MDLGPIDYANTTPPKGYRCTSCGAFGCKLWREYQMPCTYLECCDCAGKSQKRDVSRIDASENADILRGPARGAAVARCACPS